MTTLNEEMATVQAEVKDVREHLRDEVPTLFEFDVTVGNISYNANSDSVSVTIEPSSRAREQISDQLGGVNVKTDGRLEFEFRVTKTDSE